MSEELSRDTSEMELEALMKIKFDARSLLDMGSGAQAEGFAWKGAN